MKYYFLKKLEVVKWNIIGLFEVQRAGEKIIELKNGHIFFYRRQTEKEE